MAFTHVVTRAYRDSSGNSITSTESVVDNQENNYDNVAISLPDSPLHVVAWDAPRALLQSLSIFADHATLVETNESVSVAFNDLAIDASLNTKVTSAGHSFVSGDVGKYVVVLTGSPAGFTFIGANKIVSVAGGAATCATSFGTLSSTLGHWHLSDDYFTMVAGQNIIWTLATDGLVKCPFAFDVTSVFITVTGASGTAVFKIRAMEHV